MSCKKNLKPGGLMLQILRVAGTPLTASQLAKTLSITMDQRITRSQIQRVLEDGVQYGFIVKKDMGYTVPAELKQDSILPTTDSEQSFCSSSSMQSFCNSNSMQNICNSPSMHDDFLLPTDCSSGDKSSEVDDKTDEEVVQNKSGDDQTKCSSEDGAVQTECSLQCDHMVMISDADKSNNIKATYDEMFEMESKPKSEE